MMLKNYPARLCMAQEELARRKRKLAEFEHGCFVAAEASVNLIRVPIGIVSAEKLAWTKQEICDVMLRISADDRKRLEGRVVEAENLVRHLESRVATTTAR